MALQKFKNPRINNQYKKPACHTDHCFQRMACCNNYRCCVCHCCLADYAIYDKVLDTCIRNATNAKSTMPTKAALGTTIAATSNTTIGRTNTQSTTNIREVKTTTERTQGATTRATPVKRNLGTTIYKKTTSGAKTELTSAWFPQSTKNYKSAASKSTVPQRHARDDKTSTIAGVVVALALIAIVAIIVVVVVCSKKKKRRRKMADPMKTKPSADENGVVTIPLTLQNVADDSCRDPEEATTSDTTVDSPINPSEEQMGLNTRIDQNNHLTPNHPIKGPKSINRKHRKSRDGKSKSQTEQKPLYKATIQNGSTGKRFDNTSSEHLNGAPELTNGSVLAKEHAPDYVMNQSHPFEVGRKDEIEAEEQPLYENEDIALQTDPVVKVYIYGDDIRKDSQLAY